MNSWNYDLFDDRYSAYRLLSLMKRTSSSPYRRETSSLWVLSLNLALTVVLSTVYLSSSFVSSGISFCATAFAVIVHDLCPSMQCLPHSLLPLSLQTIPIGGYPLHLLKGTLMPVSKCLFQWFVLILLRPLLRESVCPLPRGTKYFFLNSDKTIPIILRVRNSPKG